MIVPLMAAFRAERGRCRLRMLPADAQQVSDARSRLLDYA